ncbi:UMP kinase activity protein [Homalodisca vitripennis]|nr:UMP kinase activity protein [Homalodisca vitripennis]
MNIFVTSFKIDAISIECLITVFIIIINNSYSYKVSFIPHERMAQRSLIVYYTLRETLNTFDTPKYVNDTRVKEMLHAFHHDCQLTPVEERRLEEFENDDNMRRKPLIVIEGTDRDTRRMVAKKLAYNLGAMLMSSPPTCLNPMRDYFTDNLVLRRAYFSLCMYAIAMNVTRNWYNHTVVLGGYWHDQATFSIAKKYTLRSMPASESPIFEWPDDLIPPDVEFFINVPQNKYEAGAAVNTFKPRLVEAYRRMKNPSVFEISGNMYHDQIRFEMEIYLQKLYRDNYRYIINTLNH